MFGVPAAEGPEIAEQDQHGGTEPRRKVGPCPRICRVDVVPCSPHPPYRSGSDAVAVADFRRSPVEVGDAGGGAERLTLTADAADDVGKITIADGLLAIGHRHDRPVHGLDPLPPAHKPY